ncbi:unnamed protein product [Dicrocoelium dendriticum]|nr:unnamed protein product [Dicrocoelium dendriticum]
MSVVLPYTNDTAAVTFSNSAVQSPSLFLFLALLDIKALALEIFCDTEKLQKEYASTVNISQAKNKNSDASWVEGSLSGVDIMMTGSKISKQLKTNNDVQL